MSILYPFLRAKKFKPNALDAYYKEPHILDMDALMESGKKWNLASTLKRKGSIIFPHTFLSKCGEQIAAAVHAILDSGADQALLLGVLHPMNESLMQARQKELNNEDISKEPSRGILVPDHPSTKKEFSLDLFKILFDIEVKRRGIKPPKLIARYPSLVNRDPANTPGIKELESVAKDSVIVATDDMCHHGIGYGVDPQQAIPLNQAYTFAKAYIEQGYTKPFSDYYDHWMNPLAIGDPTDTTIVLKYLLGKSEATILDLKIVDVSSLFENDLSPSWVAATLVKFEKI